MYASVNDLLGFKLLFFRSFVTLVCLFVCLYNSRTASPPGELRTHTSGAPCFVVRVMGLVFFKNLRVFIED